MMKLSHTRRGEVRLTFAEKTLCSSCHCEPAVGGRGNLNSYGLRLLRRFAPRNDGWTLPIGVRYTRHRALAVMMVAGVLGLFGAGSSWGKVLFLAHYNGPGADADYAAGAKEASPVPVGPYKVAPTTRSGRWGGGLDLTAADRNCTYKALGNLDPRKGTVDFWYCIDEDKLTPAPAMYHPLFGWYNPPHDPGAKKRVTALYVYTQGKGMTLSVYTPAYATSWGPFDPDVGKWHHLEINWDCTGGDGNSEYNVYLDGRSAIRKTGATALKSPGGFLHVGIWDYAWGHFLHGRIDELRITDQVEHLTDFVPPGREYPDPGTVGGVVGAYSQALANHKELTGGLERLKRAAQLAGSGPEADSAARVISDAEVAAQKADDAIKSIGQKLAAASMRVGGQKDNWLAHLEALSDEQTAGLGLDLKEAQKTLDEAADSTKTARRAVAQATGTLYARIPNVYNETVVNLGYLKDEVEGLKRVIFYTRTVIDSDKAVGVVKESDQAVRSAGATLEEVCASFYGMFADSPGGRKDPVAALHAFSADRGKTEIMETMSLRVREAADLVARTRQAVSRELQRLRSDPGFKEKFPEYRPVVPPKLPPVKVEPDGRLKRLIFAGAHGRTETLLSLGFDTLGESGCNVTWVTKDRFESTEDPKTLTQWKKYKVPISDKVLVYAIGDGMYNPPWFKKACGDDLDYYFRATASYKGSGGLEYRHPVVRKMILKYLEEAARINGQKPYTFVYKGPWEAHPYHGVGVSVPGKRTVGFQEHGFSKYAVKAFRAYLKKKFHSIARLNAAWRSSYKSFEDIQPPKPLVRAFIVSKDRRGQDSYAPFLPNQRVRATPLTYEFERCRKDLYADYLADCYKAIKRGDPKHPLASSTSGGIMNEIQINSLDDIQMAERCVDMWGKHPSGGYGWADSPYQWGLNRYFNKTLVSLEYYGWAQQEIGDDFWPTFKLAKGATVEGVYNSGRRDVWHEFNWDRRMLLFYWTQKIVEMRSGVREDNSPLVRPWASLISVVKRRTASINDILFNGPIITPRIAVLHPGVSIINAYPTDSCMNVTEDVFDRLISKQYHFGVVPEQFIMNGRDSLDNYDVVILPYVQYFDDGFGEKLLAWVRRGGTLISAGPFGLYDKYGFDIKQGAGAVFPGIRFVYPKPEKYKLSWKWHAERNGRRLSESHLAKAYGRGRVLLALDGRAFMRTGAPAKGHEGLEIGGELRGPEAQGQEDEGSTGRTVRPSGPETDKDLSPTLRAFYDTIGRAVKRKAWVTRGNVEMVIRQKDPKGPLYISLLNWDYRNGLETEVVVRGEYRNITDLSIAGGFPAPAAVNDGLTKFPVVLGPGEGLMLRLQ